MRLIEVKHGIELTWQLCPEVVTDAFGFRAVDNSDRPLDTRFPQTFGRRVAHPPGKQKRSTSVVWNSVS